MSAEQYAGQLVVRFDGAGDRLVSRDTVSGNEMLLSGGGERQILTAMQTGWGNALAVQQNGTDQVVAVSQGGASNRLGATQVGTGNRLAITQR